MGRNHSALDHCTDISRCVALPRVVKGAVRDATIECCIRLCIFLLVQFPEIFKHREVACRWFACS